MALSAPDGLAVLDAERRWRQLNPTAVELCGRPADELIGSVSPFAPAGEVRPEGPGLLDDDGAEQVCTWSTGPGADREFAYRVRPMPGGAGDLVVSFRDCSAERHRRRRVAAVARASARLAAQGSVSATLDALAREVLRADALAGVQILTVDDSGAGLQIMGSAGFRPWPDFFDRLEECRRRGADLRMVEAFDTRTPVVMSDRWAALRSDPSWAPLHDYLAELDWSWFASVPLLVRGRSAGVLNAFFAPGQVVGSRTLEFLTAMAEQAAVAIDYAALFQAERELARREERQRLARDLHDSIVQQVFSIGMQAKVLGVVAARGDQVPVQSLQRISEEVGVLSQAVLADLRAMVHELRPSSSTQLGLEEAVRALVESTTHRTGLRCTVQIGDGLDGLGPELAEDVYRIVAEALHNCVKHADARRVTLRVGLRAGGDLALTVTDDGRGLSAAGAGDHPGRAGYGLTGMRERAARWGGSLEVGPRAGGGPGTRVRAVVPVPGAATARRPARPAATTGPEDTP